MNFLVSLFEDTLGLIYPEVCITCGKHLPSGFRFVCPRCQYDIPRTNFHNERENAVEQIFWGRIPVRYAASMFYYTKGSRYQKLIHVMKYQGKKEIGYELGKIYGQDLMQSPFFDIDLIVPVPLHPRKKRKRGYNQSEWIGMGLGEVLQKPLIANNLYRAVNTNTQTQKNRFERWKNVENVFRLKSVDSIRNRHILLVDDVITTGATLESCVHVLSKCSNTSVSIVTLGYAIF